MSTRDHIPLEQRPAGSPAGSPQPGSMPADTSSAGSPAATANAAGQRVDFYVLDTASASARLKLACRLAEKAYLADQSVLVWHTDPGELKTFDELLWTFGDRSFVPHEFLSPGAPPGEAPVLLSGGVTPASRVDIIINLAPEIPPCLSQTPRIAEIIDGDETRRRAGRARFKAYRDLGLQPLSHNIRAD